MAAKLLIVLTLLGIFSAAVNAYTLTPFIGTISGSYILSTPTAVLIIDSQDSTAGGIALATAVKNIASPSVTPTIFITHAHPDHFYGLAGFATIYPAVRIFVSSQEVRDSLINYIKSAVPPPPSDIASFDYADRIQVLPSESITILDVELEVRTGFVDTESSISSVVADPSNRRLFAGDTLAINSHMFLGPPITIQWIENWISAQNGLAARYDGYTVFAGHAPGVSSGDIQEVAQKGETYLRFFVQQLCAAPSISAIPQIMQKQYPTYFGSEFTSFITINPAWQTYRNSCPTSSTASTLASQSLLFVVMMVVLGSIVIVF